MNQQIFIEFIDNNFSNSGPGSYGGERGRRSCDAAISTVSFSRIIGIAGDDLDRGKIHIDQSKTSIHCESYALCQARIQRAATSNAPTDDPVILPSLHWAWALASRHPAGSKPEQIQSNIAGWFTKDELKVIEKIAIRMSQSFKSLPELEPSDVDAPSKPEPQRVLPKRPRA